MEGEGFAGGDKANAFIGRRTLLSREEDEEEERGREIPGDEGENTLPKFLRSAAATGESEALYIFLQFSFRGKLLFALFAAALKLPSFQRYFCLLAFQKLTRNSAEFCSRNFPFHGRKPHFPARKSESPNEEMILSFPLSKGKLYFKIHAFPSFLPGHFFHVPSSQRFFFNQPTSRAQTPHPFPLHPPSFPPRRI